MMTETAAQTFLIEPLGPYSLEESANFIGAWHEAPAAGGAATGHLHLAFLTDEGWKPVGVCLTQGESGIVRGEVYGSADVRAVERQVARILSLDVDGRSWPEVGTRDRVVGMLERLQRLYGIGEFGSQLVRLRALSAVDELPTREPRLMGAIQTEYGLDAEPDLVTLERLAETWRPFRMWVAVCLRRTLAGGAGMMHSRASG